MKEQEFFEKMAEVWLKVHSIQVEILDLKSQLEELEKLGMSNATIHIRSDNGAMELIHPTGSDYELSKGRRREYVGKKPQEQVEARARVQRWQDHKNLRSQLRQKESRLQGIEKYIKNLELFALGDQARLFSEMGTAAELARLPAVPNNWDWLTPQMVIDYFEKSPILGVLADDVRTALKSSLNGDSYGQISFVRRTNLSPEEPKRLVA